ncbi:host specificity protein [Paracoccus sp. S-4012]|uniref:baseplate multidomain protein megatron n=1 Tax=Paracoccus sp. S-4012 TaxID=2665648 RepID=UPI0012B03103|nr:glycoside hydrolase/phage tail family protein [Paracoccus sp. S-4012]MRX50693.1 host specificity protein [Paracoccus sp. S-4012]
MATILLSAVGASIGAGMGGTMLGLSTAVIGRAVGATVGRILDQRLLGSGSQAVETGRIDRLRLQSAGEGTPIARIWGQMRVPGHVVWAAPLEEVRRTTGGGGGKGAPSGPEVTEISYRLSAAFALCEGPIAGVGRVWADGEEVDPAELGLRVYPGDEAQLPDPCLAAHLGEAAPAFRGIAYVVAEGLSLERWGNRAPLLTFEVTRHVPGGHGLAQCVEGVAMIPGTGEYALATTPVEVDLGLGETRVVNRNTVAGPTDFAASLGTLTRELPRANAVALVVSWFGDDLRCGECTVQPKVENDTDASMVWRAGGVSRAEAGRVAQVDGSPIYGGTPADRSVIEAIRWMRARGRHVTFYPFILMEQLEGNRRPDPWSGAADQPVMPWRGRITTAAAAGRRGSTDGTAAAADEVAAFFGSAQPEHFARVGGQVRYSGPDEWRYRRFILHYAHLCAEAGGVDAFLIGSEMVALTQVRGPGGSYPAVAALRRLAVEVRAILGPEVKLSYAADWSEYAGHMPGGGERRFHLDPLWADDAIDFIGIDNYMPLTDWREGETHLDAVWRRIDDPDYLRAGVAGGELYDWYYADPAHRDAQIRTPITDGAHGEAWIWRQKDLRGWWENPHHERDASGRRAAQPTAWVPRSKPFWFTEYGCAALDKGTNQPNKFLDARSSESMLPFYSDGGRDDAVQAAYVRAVVEHWRDPANNPVGPAGRMVDTARMHVWCWDARPWPAFPARTDLWTDGPAWARGHWLNGRAGAVPLADVVVEICRAAGVTAIDASRLSGVVRGYAAQWDETPRALLQALMLVHGFDAVEADGLLRFRMRDGRVDAVVGSDDLAEAEGLAQPELARAPEAELSGRVRVSHLEAGTDYETCTAEAILPDSRATTLATDSEFAMALTRGEGRSLAERWLAEARVARDGVRLALPPSRAAGLSPGDVLRLEAGAGPAGRWRIDRLERAGAVTIEAVRVEPGLYRARAEGDVPGAMRLFVPPIPVLAEYLDLPLLRGDEVPHAPHVAISATPWPGSAAVYSAPEAEGGFTLNRLVTRPSVVGVTLNALLAARHGVIDRGPALRVQVKGGALRSASMAALLGGANALAIGDGTPDGWEVLQFATATLAAPGVWELSARLRGQAGTDALMPEVWPAGSHVVLLDGAPVQLDLPPSARGQLRSWSAGPALRGVADASYRERRLAFSGVGLRPYAPCHLRLDGRRLTWVRRTRIGGDGWDGPEVPLGEGREAYRVRLLRAGTRLAEVMVGAPEWVIPEAVWSAAVAGGPLDAEVVQLSDLYGAGPAARRMIDA